MQKGDSNTILLTEDAYDIIIDMTEEVALEEDFKILKNIKVKHGVKLNIAHYCPESNFINSQIPKDIKTENAFKEFFENCPFPATLLDDDEPDKMLEIMSENFKLLSNALKAFNFTVQPVKELEQINGKNIE